MSEFKTLQNKFHDFIHSLKNSALGFFDNVAHTIEISGGQILRDAAMAAVLAAEQSGGSGEDKAKAALASVIAVLEAQGIPLVINAIKAAIEAAVANMRASNVAA